MQIALVLAAVLLVFNFQSFSQTNAPKKLVEASRIQLAPKIDGKLNDPAWAEALAAGEFVQKEPYFGQLATHPTEVRFIFDDDALYVGAMMYDPAPDSILKELSVRDEISNTDYFGVSIDPFNDAIIAFEFIVTVPGVQVDSKNIGSEEQDSWDVDRSWDGVWYSSTRITENGWVAEMKIPYSALRFPKEQVSTWGMNCFREIRRFREISTWNPVDKRMKGTNVQAGELSGVNGIDPPLRLALIPYVSGYLTKDPYNEKWDYSYKGGLDLKYGINESYTLDMILIPDFGQVESDALVYNLTPFEIYYEEKRPFFTEGTELFNKADLFYSRRVGGTPEGYTSVSDSLRANEKIIKNPEQAQLINATKISGKNRSGLAMGFFNGLSANTYATAKDTLTGESRKIMTEPLSNYNMIVAEQSLKNNSYVSLFNTNVFRPEASYCANVTGSDFRVATKANTYDINGGVVVSQKYAESLAPEFGFAYALNGGKTSGNFRFYLEHVLISDKYDPNDMGFNSQNNQIQNQLTFSYNIYEPFGRFIEMQNDFDIEYNAQYSPLKYADFGLEQRTYAVFRNYLSINEEAYYRPIDEHDFYEPRVDGWYYARPPIWALFGFISPDYRKRFIADVSGGYIQATEDNEKNYEIRVAPRLRISDKLFIQMSAGLSVALNDKGYITDSLNNTGQEVIIFGRRDVTTVVNSIDGRYIFNSKMSLSLRARHYWLMGLYDQFYNLQSDGHLLPNDYHSDEDFTYNAFTVDMAYRWEFSPGSELAFVWKNAINLFNEDDFDETYILNLENTLSSPATNSFSIRILYYIDSQYFKKKRP